MLRYRRWLPFLALALCAVGSAVAGSEARTRDLLEDLTSRKREARAQAAWDLGQAMATEAVPALATSLSDREDKVSRAFTTEQWLEDLEFVVTQLKAHHPHLHYRVSEAGFAAAVERSSATIRRARSDLEAFFAIRTTIASVQDGHTQLSDPGGIPIFDRRFPFRVDRFTDGIFITVIAKEHRRALGARVIAVNGTPIEDVLAVAGRADGADNDFGRMRPGLMGLTFARVVYGLGLAEDMDGITLDLLPVAGAPTSLTLRAITDTSEIGWSNRVNVGPTVGDYVSAPTLLGDATPLHLRRQGPDVAWYWFEHLPKASALYVQLNQVGNQPGKDETLAQFTGRLFSFVDAHADAVTKLIIDLRYNDGGNARRIIPLVNEIIRHARLNRRGRLFVLVGKRTYSAAVIFLTELVEHTNAIVIGDPPACPFNFFSDAEARGRLPNSGFQLMVSSRQVDNAWAPDTVFFPPDVPAPFSSRDYFSGRDPALETALHGDARAIPDIAADEGADSALERFAHQKQEYADLRWWRGWDPRALENQINERGYSLMEAGRTAAAFELFRLNTLLFPESWNAWDGLGEVQYGMGQRERSLESYRRSVGLNPENENGKRWIERITSGVQKR